MSKAGDTLTGPLNMPSGPALRWPGADKMLYSDDAGDWLGVLNIAGVLSNLTVAEPVSVDHAATKRYVDRLGRFAVVDFGIIAAGPDGQYTVNVAPGTFVGTMIPIGVGWGNEAYCTITGGGTSTSQVIGVRQPNGAYWPGANVRLMVAGITP